MKTEEPVVSVDEAHDRIDAFVLSVFEGIRGHEVLQEPNAEELKREKLNSVTVNYKEVISAIDNLPGMQMTKAEQEQRLHAQSDELNALKTSILEKEELLLKKRKDIDARLALALSDEALNLPKAS